ncbi:MAG: GEVED domain-containing protein, partial [Bacteroidota bacterium]
MKKIYLILLFATFLIWNVKAQTSTNPAPYCLGSYTLDGCGAGPSGGTQDYIHRFTLGPISNINSFCTVNPYYIRYLSSGPFTGTFIQGATYPMTVSGWTTKPNGFGVWIDYNRNQSFDDAGEFVYFTPLGTLVAGAIYTANITIPPTASSGMTRVRVRANWNNSSGVFLPTDACSAKADWGETEDYEIMLGTPAPPIPPIASFAYSKAPMDTVWIGSPRTMVNTSSGADKSYWDILGFNAITKNGPYAAFPESRTPKTSEGINDLFIDTINNAVNFRYTFPDRGFYRVKVTAVNKYGNDTYIDTVFVDTPATKPRADFFADKRVVGVYDFASMFDLTSNGPVSWYWYLKPGYYNPLAPFFNSFSPSAGAQHPIINANEGGLFDVCLVASNYRGTDTMCKPGYIKIISGYEVCKGSSTAKDTISRENEGSAKLYTVGGKYVPNLIGTCLKGFTIATCSDTATLYIDRFRMRSNVTTGVSDSLLIRSGTSTGPILARMGGSVLPAAFNTIKVPGGIAYLQTIIVNPGSGTPPGDSGYVVRWNAPPASYPRPTASFNMPDTVYDGYTVQFVNTTAGKNINYAWDTNGDNVYGIDNPSSG